VVKTCQDDSRLHRAKFCEAVCDLRGRFLGFFGERVLPPHTWAYGLWDEPASLREWQAENCRLKWQSTAEGRQFAFTDASCLSPRSPMLSIGGGSVLLARSTGRYEVVWSGLVPGLEHVRLSG
jgi:hypothetical protein